MRSLYDSLGLTDPPQSEVDRKAEVVDLLEHQKDVQYEQLADLDGQAFALAILNSRQYRESVLRRVLMDSLPAAVETRLMDHGWGKPPEKIEHTGVGGGPIISEVRRVIVDPTSYDEELAPKTVTH